MKVGYPCINLELGCRGNKTFRLRSYSDQRLVETVGNNLDCLFAILQYNLRHAILFFRVTSDLVPFASHPVCTFRWQEHFASRLEEIGNYIKRYDMRVSMHPDQFTLINSPDERIFRRSEKELIYHAQVLDLMGLDASAKVQIHVGGMYGEKVKSMERFIKRFETLAPAIRRRLVIENDDRCYTVDDCLLIHEQTGAPILLDVFHHSINPADIPAGQLFAKTGTTWKEDDGIPMVDYSSQKRGGKPGQHADNIDIHDFRKFIESARGYDFDVMLEIKDKERSAVMALEVVSASE